MMAGAAFATLAGAASAHHGVTGYYETSKPVLVAGTVTKATFSPPHPVVSVLVEATEVPTGDMGRPDEFKGPITLNAGDVGDVVEVEFSPVSTFYELRDKLRIGDRVMILALRNCDRPQQLRSSWIELSGGEVISYKGGLHRKVETCK